MHVLTRSCKTVVLARSSKNDRDLARLSKIEQDFLARFSKISQDHDFARYRKIDQDGPRLMFRKNTQPRFPMN
jgi:hypothetical protein